MSEEKGFFSERGKGSTQATTKGAESYQGPGEKKSKGSRGRVDPAGHRRFAKKKKIKKNKFGSSDTERAFFSEVTKKKKGGAH